MSVPCGGAGGRPPAPKAGTPRTSLNQLCTDAICVGVPRDMFSGLGAVQHETDVEEPAIVRVILYEGPMFYDDPMTERQPLVLTSTAMQAGAAS